MSKHSDKTTRQQLLNELVLLKKQETKINSENKTKRKRPHKVQSEINNVKTQDTEFDTVSDTNSESTPCKVLATSTINKVTNNTVTTDKRAKELKCDVPVTKSFKNIIKNTDPKMIKQTHHQANVPTNNKFEVLAQDDDTVNMDAEQTTQDETQKNDRTNEKPPPPIVIHGQSNNHNDLMKRIKLNTKSDFNVKYTRNNINITLKNREERTELMNDLIKDKIEFHTYADTTEKTHAFVIRGLTSDITPEDITEDLQTKYGLTAVNCYKMVFKQQAVTNRALFLLVTKSNITLKDTIKIKYLIHTRVYFERRRNNRRITQCHSCQAWGHATSNCHAKIKCMFCADNHPSKTCLNKANIKCANCSGAHQSNDTKCSVYVQKLQWIDSNNQLREQQKTNTYNHREEEYPALYKPAPPPEHNAWKSKATQNQQGPQQQPQTQQQQQQSPPQQQQQQRQQQTRQQPTTQERAPRTTHPRAADSFNELTAEFATLHSLVNIDELTRAVRDLNSELKKCTSKQDIFQTFTQFTKYIDNYDI